jgi:hypothetical protein
MVRIHLATVQSTPNAQDVLGMTRTELVHLPYGADCTLFGGWGVKI